MTKSVRFANTITALFSRGGGKTISYLLAAVLALGAATTAEAARNWTGSATGNFSNKSNWSSTSGRRYFKNGNLTGEKITRIYLSANVTESSNSGLCFDTPPTSSPTYWRFRSSSKDTIYTYNNSGGKEYDTGILCVGYEGRDSKARFYAVNFNTKNFTIGGDPTYGGADIVKGNMTGYLILDDLDDNASSVWAPVNITAATCDFYNGDLYATNATITSSGNMTLYTFNAEKTGGDWTLNGDLIIGAKAGASATFTQNSGTVTVKNNKWTKSTSGNGTLNLNGGTFVTQRLTDADAGGSLAVNINGGTVKANNAHANGLIGHGNGNGINVNVGENGGTIDTDGRDISIHVAVNAVENTTGAFTVTGGGSATFSAMGNLAGALTVGDNTALHWFDQDGAVSAACGFTSLALGAGSTVYLNGDATGVDALPATVTTTATTENKANLVINFSAIPATGTTFTLFPAASADVFNVQPMAGSLVLPNEVAVVDGNLVLTIVAEDYTWNGTQTNWGDADAWTKGGAVATWSDGNNAIFSTANATATLAANASPAKIDFTADATVNGTATLTVPVVSVVPGVSATISAPTADSLVKTGTGMLVLGSSRTDETTVSEGTLAMPNGTTVDGTKLTLGTDAAKPVTFDYGGQTLTADPTVYLGAGMDVTLTNGVFAYGSNITFANDTFPKVLTIADGATLQTSGRYSLNTSGEATINIAGGTLKSDQNNNWVMQASYEGCLNINLTDKGLLEFGGEVYMLTCRDGNNDYQSPELHITASNYSTVRVGNGKSIRFGRDDSTKSSAKPVFSLAASNSTFDIGYGMYLGNDNTGLSSEGKYTAAFEDCVITARQFCVYSDRTLNNASFNSTRLVFNTNDSFISAADGDAKWITVGDKGLTIDTQSYAGSLRANLGGTGPVAKVGAGTLEIQTNQTASAALNVNEGTIKFARVCTSCARALSLADGTTVVVSGDAPVELGSLALPASGTVTLTNGGAAFAKGVYRIFSCDGLSVLAVQDKLVPSIAEGEQYSWSVEDGVLVLNVGNLFGNAWTGFAGDGKMSSDANWLDRSAPVAGDAIDFSGVSAETTIDADIDATFGAVTMGSGIITFSGSLTASSFSDTSKVAVGANATVTITENCTQTPLSGREDMVYSIGAGGKLVFAGTFALGSGANDGVNPQTSVGDGVFVVNRLENNADGRWIYVMTNGSHQKWVVGPGGIGGTTATGGLWLYSNTAAFAEFQANTNDFEVALPIVFRQNADYLTFNTTGYGDGEAHTITLSSGIYNNGEPLNISGTGKVVANFYGTANYGSYAPYSGEVKVNDTATLAVNHGKRLTTGKITFAAGTTLEVPSAGVEMGEIAFSGEGTVMLKVLGSELADGEYTVLTSTSALATDIVNKFTLDASAVKGIKDAWLTGGGDGKSLVLNIGDRSLAGPGIWVGGSGVNMSTAANWKNGQVPSANEPLDFSGVTVAKTINADVNATFGAVAMGTGVITFNGTLTASSFSDTSKVSVGANATVTFDGDLMFTGSGTKYVVYKVDAGGKFIVTGKVGLASGASGHLQAQDSPGTGIIVAGSLVNDSTDNWIYVAHDNNSTKQKWAIGPGGITGTCTSAGMWVYSNNKVNPEFQPNTNDFTVSLWTVLRESAKSFTYNTTGLDGNGYTITLDAGFSDKTAPLYVTGTGKVVVNHVTKSFGGKNAYSGPVTVTNSATLAINADKKLTSGAITMNTGTTLEVAQSGDVTLDGALTCAAGSTLKFNFTTGRTAPKLVLSQTPTFGEVKVSLSGVRPAYGMDGKHTIIEWPEGTTWPEGFDIGSVFTLADNQPKWVTGIAVEGNSLVLTSKPAGIMFVVK